MCEMLPSLLEWMSVVMGGTWVPTVPRRGLQSLLTKAALRPQYPERPEGKPRGPAGDRVDAANSPHLSEPGFCSFKTKFSHCNPLPLGVLTRSHQRWLQCQEGNAEAVGNAEDVQGGLLSIASISSVMRNMLTQVPEVS